MKCIFPYGIRFLEDGRIETFPAADISVLGGNGDGLRDGLRALFHIDSGATTSVLPVRDAEALGISLSKKKRLLVRGLGDISLPGYRSSVRLAFNRLTIRVPVIFVEHAAVPRILGREGIFPRFGVLFDEAKRRVGLFKGRHERQSLDRLFQ